MLKKISVSPSYDDKFNIQKSRVSYFVWKRGFCIAGDWQMPFLFIAASLWGWNFPHTLSWDTNLVSSQKSLTAPVFILFLGLHPPLSDWTLWSRSSGVTSPRGMNLDQQRARPVCDPFLQRSPTCLPNPPADWAACPFQAHLDIADGTASHCFAISLVWLPLPPHPHSPRPALTDKIRTSILAPGYAFQSSDSHTVVQTQLMWGSCKIKCRFCVGRCGREPGMLHF